MTGNELKERRVSLDLRQEDLARELEVVVSSVARWEQLKNEEIPNSKMLESALEKIGREKLKEYVESTLENELLKKIWFDFNSIEAWNGWLETHFSNSYFPMETLIDSEKLKLQGIEMSDNENLRKAALEQFKVILGLNRPPKVKGENKD